MRSTSRPTSRSTRARSTALALTLAAAIALTGCSAMPPEQPETIASTAPEPSVTESAEPSESIPPTDEPAASVPGDYVDYEPGIIESTPGTKALFFHASWCPKCRALEEDILANDIPDNFTIIKVDFDSETELRQRYAVTLQTTIVYVDDDGAALAKGVLYDDTTLDALLAAAP